MTIKYQSIKRFAQREGLNMTEVVNGLGTPSIVIKSGNYTTTISRNESKEGYDIKVVNEFGHRVISGLRFSQKAVIECLQSADFVEYITADTVEDETEGTEGTKAEAEAGEEPADAEVVEVVDMKQLKKELQRGMKEIRTQYGLNADMLKVSFTERQQEQGQFTIGTCESVLTQYGEVIHAFCEKFGTYVATEKGTFKYSRRLRFNVRTADADYYVVKEYRNVSDYLDAVVDNSYYSDLDAVLSEDFMEYIKVMHRLGNICIG